MTGEMDRIMDLASEIDWTGCELVERVPGKVSGRPLVRGTRILPDARQSMAAAARPVGIAEQTLFNRVRAQRQGRLPGLTGGRKIDRISQE